MAGEFTVTITGDQQVAGRLSATANGMSRIIPVALQAGGLLVQNHWKSIAPYRTGTYRRSIHLTIDGLRVLIGSNVLYARRLEYGFSGRDALGRLYHQPPGGYARRATAAQRSAVVNEVARAVRAQLARVA